MTDPHPTTGPAAPHPAPYGAALLAAPGDAAARDLVIGERDRSEERTLKARMARRLARFLERLVVVCGLSVLVLPLLLAAMATLDLPLSWFDGWAAREGLKASHWLSRGEALLTLSVMLLILMTRRYGAGLVGRVQGLSWLLAIGSAALMLLYLAPELTQADMPRGRYVIGLVVSWYAGQHVAITTYDMVRGGRWWRAPFYAALFGLGVQSLLFFPLAYGGAGVPLAAWMLSDLCLKVLAAAAFLGPYWLVRRVIEPRGGLGGLAVLTTRTKEGRTRTKRARAAHA